MGNTRYRIENEGLLRKILWADTWLGGSTALLVLLWGEPLAGWLGLASTLLRIVGAVTGIYALGAWWLAVQRPLSVAGVRTLVMANWAWTPVSMGLLITQVDRATLPGLIFLVLQVLVVGGLALLEGRQLVLR